MGVIKTFLCAYFINFFSGLTNPMPHCEVDRKKSGFHLVAEAQICSVGQQRPPPRGASRHPRAAVPANPPRASSESQPSHALSADIETDARAAAGTRAWRLAVRAGSSLPAELIPHLSSQATSTVACGRRERGEGWVVGGRGRAGAVVSPPGRVTELRPVGGGAVA